ncbi:hypothetical protein Tco_0060861 [Tanacetum coccineum]
MGRGTGQMGHWGAEHGSMMGRGTGQMGRWGAEHGSMMGWGTGQMGCWGVEHGSTSHLALNEWRMPLRPPWNRNMDQTLVGLGTWGDPRLMVTSRTSSSSSSWYAHHTGSSPSEQVEHPEGNSLSDCSLSDLELLKALLSDEWWRQGETFRQGCRASRQAFSVILPPQRFSGDAVAFPAKL